MKYDNKYVIHFTHDDKKWTRKNILRYLNNFYKCIIHGDVAIFSVVHMPISNVETYYSFLCNINVVMSIQSNASGWNQTNRIKNALVFCAISLIDFYLYVFVPFEHIQ